MNGTNGNKNTILKGKWRIKNMTIWNVSLIYYGNDKVRYTVLPYNLQGTIVSYLKHDKLKRLVVFLLNSRLTEKSARKYAEKKSKQHDIEW